LISRCLLKKLRVLPAHNLLVAACLVLLDGEWNPRCYN
jgi:hypothetical protein